MRKSNRKPKSPKSNGKKTKRKAAVKSRETTYQRDVDFDPAPASPRQRQSHG